MARLIYPAITPLDGDNAVYRSHRPARERGANPC